MESEALATQFFTATATADRSLFHEICSSDFTGSQNGGPSMTTDQLADFSSLVLQRVKNFRYENVVKSSTANGFVEEHDVCCDFDDGSSLRMRVCVVADVIDGRINSVREYADSRAARKLLEALA
jgi:ketosteroid isomerase-like protein